MLLLYNKVRNLNYVESGDQREKLLSSAKIAEPHKKKKKKKLLFFAGNGPTNEKFGLFKIVFPTSFSPL